MRNSFKITGLAFLLTFGPTAAYQAFAQKTWNNDGKLESTEIVVEKNRVIELPEASRNYEKFRIEPPAKQIKPVTYRFADYKLPDQDVELSVRVLTIRQEDLTKLYGNYVKAGFGNYTTPYLKGYFHNKRSADYSFGGNISHISSSGTLKDEETRESDFEVADSEVGINGELYRNNLTVGGRLNYHRDNQQYDFPSLNAELPDLKRAITRNYSRVGGEAYFNNKLDAKSKLQYRVGAGLNYLSGDAKTDIVNSELSETNGFGSLNLQYFLSDKSRIDVFSDVSVISQNDKLGDETLDTSRPLFRIRPSYQMDMDKLDISVGATLGYTGDTLNNADKINFYPAVRVGYEAIDNKLVIFGGAGGDLQRVSLFELTRENPWLSPGVRVADTDKQLDIYGGLTGSLIPNLQFTLKASYLNFKNLFFFNNSPADSLQYDLVYDKGTTNAMNFFGELVYNQSDKFRLGVKMDYYNWNPETLEEPFYRPSTQASFFGTYNLYNKILFNAELYYLSNTFGKFTRGIGTEVLRETDSVVDLNLKVDYRVSEKFSAFVMLNNILNMKYERYLNYPVKGFNAIGGISYIF